MKPTRALPVRRQRLLPHGACWRLWCGIVLWGGLAAEPVFAAKLGRESSSRSRAHAVQSDSAPTVQATPSPGSDLLLTKQGEHTADALAAYADGLAAEEDADTERAMDAYRKALSFDPGNTELAVKVAFELARRGDVPQGLDLLKDAAKAAPTNYLPPLWISQIYEKNLKKPELAERYALRALALAPDNFAPYLALCSLYATQGQTRKAEALLEKAAKSASTDVQFWLALTETRIRASLKGDAAPSPEDLSRINPLLEKVRTCAKGDLEALAKLADFYVLTRQVKEAIPLYMHIIEKSKGSSGEELLAVRDKLARSLLASGQRDQAIVVLEQMVKDSPLRYETYEMLGELYVVNKQWEKAVASYQQALLIDSSQYVNYLRVADIQLRLLQPQKAVQTLTEARGKFPGVPKVTYSLAVALSLAKQHVKALSTFEEALQEAKNSTETILTAAFYFQYGAAAEQAGELTKSAEMLRKSIQMDPTNAAHACNYLGYMWVDRGINLEEGGELIKRAVALDPDEGAYLDSLGWYYFKSRKYDEALAKLKQAFDHTQPEDATIDEHLGDVYAARHELAQATAMWKKALALDPTNKGLAGKLEKAQQAITAAPPLGHTP